MPRAIVGVLVWLVLAALGGAAWAQGYTPPPRGAPDGRVGGASRDVLSDHPRVALVIGNGAYQYLPRLENPKNDAQLMAETLKSLGFELIGGGPLTDLDRRGFENAIRKFGAALSGGAIGLFYYAGHGVQVQGANYLIPVGANPATPADLDFELIDAGLVLRQMEAAGSKLNFVILDACRNNPFGGRGLRDARGGLAQMYAPTGTLISYATQPGNVAADGKDGHSPYTEALATAMQQPGLGVFEVFNTAAVTVKNQTGGDQQPWVSNSPIEGTFYFVAPVTVNITPAPDPEVIFWQSVSNSSNPADFEAYLSKYPSGQFTELAKNRVAALRAAATPPPPPPAPEVVFWQIIQNSNNAADFDAYLSRYPNGQFAAAAQARAAQLRPPPSPPPPAKETTVAMAVPPPAPPPEGEAGWSTDQKREVQEALRALGHFRGDSDGNFGPQSRAAIKQYQSFAGDDETGTLTESERHELIVTSHRLDALLAEAKTSPSGVAAASLKGGPQRLIKAASFETSGNAGEAVYWYRLAAVDGEPKAFTNLGTLMVRGQGADKDTDGARLLWEVAAARGEPIAMYNLGALYEHGIGVDANTDIAKKWYARAAALGHPQAREALKRLGG
jgi:TPR repeat protein